MSNEKVMLIADDIELNRFILREMFCSEYKIVEAVDGEQALQKIQDWRRQLSVILLDVMMPKKDGFEVLQEIQKNQGFDRIPVIMITAIDGTEIRALQSGAWDYIQKPFDIDVVKSRVDNVVKRSIVKENLNQEKILYQKKLNYLAEYDLLTGIYNRNAFFGKVESLLADYPDHKFVIGRLDINRFKTINELFGKEEGDSLLIYIAKAIKKATAERADSVFGRMERDIFSICFSYGGNKAEILEIMDAIEKQIIKYNLTFEIVTSYGFYIVEDRELSIDIMCDRANLALQTVKGNYVNRYAFYDHRLHNKILKEQEIVSQMKAALAEEQFHIYLQPKCNLMSGRITGAEALVRWVHPQKGLIPPAEFIGVFEANGFIMKMDAYVWEKVCQLIKRWGDDGRQQLPLSVNISRINLYNPELCNILIRLVEKYQIDPRLLQLELTESAYTDNPALLNEVMVRLREYGFTIMMDDFGSGYSSLNMLKDLPVDILKIDLKFLSDGENKSGKGANILSSVVRMAKWLSLPVIVEGVETREQVTFLNSIGCTRAQGYYFAKPMPVAEFEKIWDSQGIESDLAEEGMTTQNQIEEIWEESICFDSVVHNMIGGLGIYEQNNGIIEATRLSDSFFNMMHGTREEYYQKVFSIMDWIPEEDKDTVRLIFHEAARTKGIASGIYRRRCLDDSVISVHLKAKYLDGDRDRQIFLVVVNDITEELKRVAVE